MLQAARNFLDSLDNHLQRQVLFRLDSPERLNWNYKPVPRRGVPLRQLSVGQRRAALALLEAVLSREGYAKSIGIMELESILSDLEGRAPDDRTRDPQGYFLSVFGRPEPRRPWGWRIDGHHLSFTFTTLGREDLTVTPGFMGANPAEVPHGPQRGWRVLRDEELQARRLVESLEADRREQAIIAAEAPDDIITGTRRRLEPDAPVGLPAGAMSARQEEQLLLLLHTYIGRLRPDLAEREMQRVRKAGLARLHFAWAGGLQPGEGHYYRIQGPTLLIEYDNTQNNANHIHSVMRDPERDFGGDPLEEHYAACPHDS